MTLLRYLRCLWQGHDWGNVWTIARGKPEKLRIACTRCHRVAKGVKA